MITDNFLNEMAKALANESYVVPAYLVFGSDVISESASSTSLTGEAYSRVALTDSRASNVVTFTGLKTGASIASSVGHTLNAMAINSSASGGTHLSETLLSSIIHTTAFDVEVEARITNARA